MMLEYFAPTFESIARFLGDLLLLISNQIFMKLFFNRVKNKNILSITYIIYFICLNIIFRSVRIPILLVTLNIFFIFLITYNYESKTRTKIIATIYLYTIMTMVDTITANLLTITGFQLFDDYHRVLGSLMSSVFVLFFVIILKSGNLLKSGNELPKRSSIVILLIPMSSTFITYYLFSTESGTNIFMLLFSAYLCILNLLVFYLYDDLVKKFIETIHMHWIQQQNEYYEKQLNIMMESQESMRKYRHDSKTKLLVLETMLEQGEVDKAKEYMNGITNIFKAKEAMVSTGNMAIDAVMNYKLQQALANNIVINFEMQIPENLNVDAMDISVLLGNLLDNAITAVNQLQDEKVVFVVMKYDRNLLHIFMKNKYLHSVHCVNGRYFTTKKDLENHGFGLLSVNDIVNKYQGLMEINHEQNQFKVNIVLFLS